MWSLLQSYRDGLENLIFDAASCWQHVPASPWYSWHQCRRGLDKSRLCVLSNSKWKASFCWMFLFLLCFWKFSKGDSQQSLVTIFRGSNFYNFEPLCGCVEHASIQEYEPENPFNQDVEETIHWAWIINTNQYLQHSKMCCKQYFLYLLWLVITLSF